MPTYDYRCPACDDVFEVNRPMGSTDSVCCPACGEIAKKVFSPVGVAFKGTGFHNTDYKSKPSAESTSCSSAGTCPAAGGCDKAS